MFSERLKNIVAASENIMQKNAIGEGALLSLLEKSAKGIMLDVEEMTSLMCGTYQEKCRKMILEFSKNYERPHDRDILLLPPLYFSSTCENNCLYCDFSSDGHRLTLDDFSNEFNTLIDMGYRSIELVSAQDPAMYLHDASYDLVENQVFHIDEVLKYFAFARKRLDENGGGMLTSNIPPVDVGSLGRLKSAGLNCYLLWLETFNPRNYSKMHYQKGPKANQAFRLDSFESAYKAGIEHFAGAFLKGLYDWRKEEVVFYFLDRYLKEKAGHGFSIIGTPRLKGAFSRSDLVREYMVSDEDYELNVALDRILFDGILWLQTRESFETNRHLIAQYGGGVILTLSSSTAPGGYFRPTSAKPQFPVFKQDLDNSVSLLQEGGCQVHFNWDSKVLSSFQRNGNVFQGTL